MPRNFSKIRAIESLSGLKTVTDFSDITSALDGMKIIKGGVIYEYKNNGWIEDISQFITYDESIKQLQFINIPLPETNSFLTLNAMTGYIGYTPMSEITSGSTGYIDVSVSNPTNNQILAYNSSSSKWENVDNTSGSINDSVSNSVYTWSSSKIQSEIDNVSNISTVMDYSMLFPAQIRSNISAATGGTNYCLGKTATYTAGENILAGRVLSLMDASDDTVSLKVGYLKDEDERSASIYPIGVSQHNCSAGDTIKLCVEGYTTVISYNSDNTPERGSQVMASPTASKGKVYINITGSGNEGRLGFMAQSDAIVANSPFLIFYSGWYQPY